MDWFLYDKNLCHETVNLKVNWFAKIWYILEAKFEDDT